MREEANIEQVIDPRDPRLWDFIDLRDVQLRSRREPAEGLFIAEGTATIRRAVDAGYPVRSVLLLARWIEPLRDLLDATSARVLVVDDELLERTTGFPVHRGALASMQRLPVPRPEAVLADAHRVAVLEDLTDHTNVGALFRGAAALGVEAVALTPRCADPLYRRAIRTSMGAVFSLPWTRLHWKEGPGLLRSLGFTLVALTPSRDATPITDLSLRPDDRVALAFGTEGTGLSSYWLGEADERVRIPMRSGIDSLNVGAAAAVAFFALGRGVVGAGGEL